MRISEYLSRDFVVPHLQSTDVEGVVAEVARCAASLGLGDEGEIAERLIERERTHSTVMGSGLAIPHATVGGLPGPIVGVALTDHPIDFGGGELGPVQVFFVLLSPPGHEAAHIRLLARICRLTRDDDFIAKLQAAGDGPSIVKVVETLDASHV